jgi:chromosomal replication initiation ATPase DnaA
MEAIQHTALVPVNGHARAVDHDDDDLLDRVRQYFRAHCVHTADIKTAICQFYCVDLAELNGGIRAAEVAYARQMFCYLAYRYTFLSMASVGRKVGLADHSTVQHAIRKIEKRIAKHPLLADDVDVLHLKMLELTLIRRGTGRC